MPLIRPFRGLRYDPELVGDIARVVAPPYDVISPAQLADLLGRHPRNVVRLELPTPEPGEEEDERYRRAARTFAAWRSDGTLRKDPQPSLYVYEQTFRIPGGGQADRTQCGFFGRLRLEPFGPGAGVRPHERTMAGPKEDRYRLMRATGANMSPVVGLFRDTGRAATAALSEVAGGDPDIELVDDAGVRHRVWVVPDAPEGSSSARIVADLCGAAGANPITIADGHHRYETALRYHDDRRSVGGCEEDPPFDYILMLVLDANETLTVLPTHRVVRALGDEVASGLLSAAQTLFEVSPVSSRRELETSSGEWLSSAGGEGRFGLWTRSGGAVLVARRSAFEPLVARLGEAVRRLDVSLLGAALERLCGLDPAAVAAGERVTYTKSAVEALDWVDRRADSADAAFLLEPTPVADVEAVAAAGDVMPQKSTYFYPKALTGLVINPLES